MACRCRFVSGRSAGPFVRPGRCAPGHRPLDLRMCERHAPSHVATATFTIVSGHDSQRPPALIGRGSLMDGAGVDYFLVGIRTASMTWMTPLLAVMSVFVTLTRLPAASTRATLSPDTSTVS